MDSSALLEVVMGSTFTLCCTAVPPLPLCLESALHLTSRHLLQPHRHGQTGTGHLPSLATLEDEFPTLPSPRGACPDPASSWSHSAPHVLMGCTLGSETLGLHFPSAPQGKKGDKGMFTHWRQEWEPDSATELCQLLCLGTLGQKAG